MEFLLGEIMRGLIPFGGLKIVGGSQTLALATTNTLFSLWSATGGSLLPSTGGTGSDSGGDYSVKPDLSNNRVLLLCPGVYRYNLQISGTIDGTQNITSQLRKNAATLIDGTKRSQSWLVTTNHCHSNTGIFSLSASDNPGTIPNFADPSATGYAGAGAAAKDLCPIDVVLLSGASTPTITVAEASWVIERIG